MAHEIDPFTQVYNTLWDILESRKELTDMVKLGNRIKFVNKNVNPVRNEVSTSDLPSLMLVPTGTTPLVQNTSSSSMAVERYEIRVSTGDQRIDINLYPLKFAILRAMASWATKMNALTWKTKAFVVRAHPISIDVGLDNDALNRGIIGWAAIWSCEVQMTFTTSDLQGS